VATPAECPINAQAVRTILAPQQRVDGLGALGSNAILGLDGRKSPPQIGVFSFFTSALKNGAQRSPAAPVPTAVAAKETEAEAEARSPPRRGLCDEELPPPPSPGDDGGSDGGVERSTAPALRARRRRPWAASWAVRRRISRTGREP